MPRNTHPRPRYNARLLAEDMGARGWQAKDIARIANVSSRQVSRFLCGDVQTAKMARVLAGALGRSPARYLIRTVQPEPVR